MTWDYLDAQKGARQTLFYHKSAGGDQKQSPSKKEREREKIVSNTKHIRRKPPN
jgi:hypothetical protein